MKTIKQFSVIFLVAISFSLVQLSCHTTVKTAVSCPKFSIKKSDYNAHHRKSKSKMSFVHRRNISNQNIRLSKQIKRKDIENNNYPILAKKDRNIYLNKIEYNKGLIVSTDNFNNPIIRTVSGQFPFNGESIYVNKRNTNKIQPVYCDTIFLKSGTRIIGKVEEIGQNEIKYRKCNNLAGPIISLLKSDASMILYSNGTDELFDPSDKDIPKYTNSSYYDTTTLKTEGLGLAGFISGLVGLFIASIPLGIIAVIFGGISLSKIKKNPKKFRGKGFAITSIILGIVEVVVMIILLGAV